MTSQDEDADLILRKAREICGQQGHGVTITLVGTIGDQFVVIFNIASLHEKEPAARDLAISEIASNLQKIKGVARVCYEVLPDPRGMH